MPRVEATEAKGQNRPGGLSIALPAASFLPNLGGLEVGLHNIACRLVDRGHRPVVMTALAWTRRLQQLGWELPYQVAAVPPRAWTLLNRYPRLALPLFSAYFAWMQRRYRFDLWHVTLAYPTGVPVIHFRRQWRPVAPMLLRCAGEDIQRLPDIGYGFRLDSRIDALVRDTLPEFSRLVAITDSVAREYRALNVAETRIRAIPNGVDLARFRQPFDRDAWRGSLGYESECCVFLSIGRNHRKKSYGTLIEAAARLRQLSRHPFCVEIVGRETQALVPLVQQHGLEGHIRLTEEIGVAESVSDSGVPELPSQELIARYRSADVFVFPSLIETFGIALVEAMAAGLPVITTDADGCRDVVRGGRDAALVPAGDAEALAAAMARTLEDHAWRRDLADRAGRRAEAFDWNAVVGSYCALYEEMLAEEEGKNRDGRGEP